jgi:hypothetical protein
LTGRNISAELGYHYGPKPNPEVAAYLNGETLFSKCVAAGKRAALLNAYPPRYFDGIDSGKRLYSSIPLAVTNAGLELFRHEDMFAGRALSADFTGEGWRTLTLLGENLSRWQWIMIFRYLSIGRAITPGTNSRWTRQLG